MGLLDLFRKKGQTVANVQSTQSFDYNVFYDYKTDYAYRLYYGDELKFCRLKLPEAIVSEVVRSACQELDFKTNSSNDNIIRIEKFLKDNIKIMEGHLCICGRVALKPYIKSNRVGVSIYGGRDFMAYYDGFGNLEKVYFKSDIRISEFESYTLVEIHSYDESTREYRIENNLYTGIITDQIRKTGSLAPRLGARVPLTKCSKTKDLLDFYVIEDVDRHLCSVINLQNSMTYNQGRSIYASSFRLIEDAEKQYDSTLWEYEGGEMAIDANADLFKASGSSNSKGYELPHGKDRLYRRLPGADADFSMETFAPTLRDQSYWKGLNEILRKIETNTGLYFGAISNLEDSLRTATEVIASKQRFYVLVMDIKNKIAVGIQDILESANVLACDMIPSFMSESLVVTFDIGDSVLDLIVEKSTGEENE